MGSFVLGGLWGASATSRPRVPAARSGVASDWTAAWLPVPAARPRLPGRLAAVLLEDPGLCSGCGAPREAAISWVFSE